MKVNYLNYRQERIYLRKIKERINFGYVLIKGDNNVYSIFDLL